MRWTIIEAMLIGGALTFAVIYNLPALGLLFKAAARTVSLF
jgi:hypothetical protein